MKVLAINSSPRKTSLSKTSLMLQNLVEGMRDAGAWVDVVDIQDKKIDYCTACFACFNRKFNEREVCIFKDDMTLDLLPKWRAADLVVYASPVFFHSITSKLKTFFERTLPVYVSFSGGEEGSYAPGGKPSHPALAFLAVSGSPEDSAFDDYSNYVRCFEPIAEIYRNGSTLMSLPFCKDRVADILAATREAGAELVRELRISDATMARIRQPLQDDTAFLQKIADAHQTLLPGHRALMTFPAEVKRELRKMPATPATSPDVDVNMVDADSTPPPVRRRLTVVSADRDRHARTLARLRQEKAEAPAIASDDGASWPAPSTSRTATAASAPAARRAQDRDDVAIIGMSGRFASADDLESLWRALEQGENLVTEAVRWDLRARYASEPEYGRHGGFLPTIDRFDALFFKIAGNEARYMDPQQRIFLEEAWRALEDAGYAGRAVSDTRCGVYVGCGDGDYRQLFSGKTPPQAFWGNAASVIPARIAYFLDLKGPAVAVDTACSSSLVAIHGACQALRAGEVEMAISGGVFLQCTPRLYDAANGAGMLSAIGRCATFDAGADGFVIGEGCGVVVLKRLADAVAAGDHIHGVIKGSGINQDGATNGLTAPSAASQERLISETYERFGVDPGSIGFVECHGTGTKLGDPIEFDALDRVFRRNTDKKRFCAIGSIKTNIGHAGAAAGVAGLLKALLALRMRKIPASLHFTRANPLVRLDGGPFYVPVRTTDWEAGGQPRRAAVSSFGFSGTNAHLVVEEPPPPKRRAAEGRPQLIVLSARSPDQLRRAIGDLRARIEADPDLDLAHIAFTLLTGRRHGKFRFACIARDCQDLSQRLREGAAEGGRLVASEADASGDQQRQAAGAAAIAMARDADGDERAWRLEDVAERFLAGETLDYEALFVAGTHRRICLPPTPFERRIYWVDPATPPEGSKPSSEILAPPAVDALPAGDILLVPTLEAVDLAAEPFATEASPTILVVAPDADMTLVRSLRRDIAASRIVSLNAAINDEELQKALGDALAAVPAEAARVIWIAPRPDETQAVGAGLPEAQSTGVLLLFRAVRGLLAAGLGARPLDWIIVTQQTGSVHGETTCPDHAAIPGFVGSLANEAARWTFLVADLALSGDDLSGLATDLVRLPASRPNVTLYGRPAGGRRRQWYRRRLVPASDLAPSPPPYRRGGVFIVFGGAGGVGRTWSEHVIRECKAQIVWIGRRKPDATISAELDRLAAFGPRPHYISADCARAGDVSRAFEEIRARFGAVHGLVFSTIVLRDAAVANLTVTTFEEALAPKVDLSVHALHAFGDAPLDFVLFFSSLIAITTSAGQSNYAAGCAFSDALAERLGQELACPVKVMDWGYWGEVGIVSGPEYRARMAQLGVASIEGPEAMQALATLLSHGPNRLAFMKAARPVAIPHVDVGVRVELRPSPALPAIAPAAPLATGEEMRALRPQLRVLDDIETAIAPIVAEILSTADVPAALYLREWRREADGFIAARRPVRSNAVEAWAAWDRQRAAWRADTDYHARCQLVDATLRALPDILAGRRQAIDVMFPGGSLHLVEPIYRNNLVADAFNSWMAAVVVAEVERLAGDGSTPVRILEIGAGTGGTTAGVIERLRASGCDTLVAEYAYTDVSNAFLRHGRERFAADAGYLAFRLLDIASPLAGQGFDACGYDIVIAANVLHATPRIRQALRHAKQALKPGGLLLLNEISRHKLLTHLTFGLLDAWWAARDRDLRMPGGPALSPEGWRAALCDEGFGATAFPVPQAHMLGQQIVVSRSDGLLRLSTHAPAPQDLEPAPAAPAVVQAIVSGPAAPHEPTQEEVARVEALVVESLSTCLGVEARAIDAGEPFVDYGLDSLNAAQLVQILNSKLGCALKPAELYSYTSVTRLSRHIILSGFASPLSQLPVAAPDMEPVLTPVAAPVAVSVPAPAAPQPLAVDPDAIAVIGMSGRFGGAETLDDLWRTLRDGVCLIGWSDRWPQERHRGAFCADLAGFDAGFFNISGLEAAYMDPQQRAFLQEAWKALEDAGYAGDGPEGVRGREVGVFVGCYPGDYFQLADERAPAQAMWGAAGAVIPARLSYFLDLHGPAVAVDTACSSSLVAVHQACRSLAAGDCEMAVAGGVALQSTTQFFGFATRANMLSPSGRCHAFEARADGFAVGEGVGVVILKRLDRALADRDHIHGVIRGSGVNQDGASNGITAPNGEAQLRLLRATYAAARIDPATIGLLEAHGTGTKLGDPIEFDALRAHFAGATPGSCSLGSIKANIGHTLAAAGIAGLIKTLLALRYATLPPAPDFQAPNPALALAGSPFTIDRTARVWRSGAAARTPLRAAVSSFGFSGTNAHVIVEEAPRAPLALPDAGPRLFVLSAASAAQLRQTATRLSAHLRRAAPDLAAVSFTLLAGRRAMAHRLAFVAASADALQQRLDNFLAGVADPDIFTNAVDPGQSRDAGRSQDGRDAIERLLQEASPPTTGTLTALARLFVAGHGLPADRLFPRGGQRTPLPVYPFQEERYWVPEPATDAVVNSPTPAVPDASRLQKLWRTEWRETPLGERGAPPPSRAIILASPPTWSLAQQIAGRIPGAVVVDASTTMPPGEIPDTVIDCVGCAPVAREALEWLPWAQGLATPAQPGPGRYVCLTRGLAAVAPGDAVAAPDGRVTRAALARMLQSEYRRLKAAHVDFAPTTTDAAIVDGALAELSAGDGAGTEIAWRDTRRYVAALVDIKALTTEEDAPFPADKALWITGGTRGLGLLCAGHFARRHGVRKMFLTGRNPVRPPDEWPALAGGGDPAAARYRRYLDLQRLGVALEVMPLDLCDADAVRRALTGVEARLGQIGGFLHCAGLADVETPAFIRKTAEGVRRILAPKTIGLETVWSVLRRETLDFALLFSSVTAAVPALAVGQSDYAMANAYLDAFARHSPLRTSTGRLVTISLQWPNWRDTGMGEVKTGALADSGLVAMTDAEGLALLDRVLAARPAPVVLPSVMSAASAPDLMAAACAQNQTPTQVDPTPAQVDAWLADVFAAELIIARDRLKPNAPFHDYGVDSILLTQLSKTLGALLGCDLDPSLFYTSPTLAALSQWLRDNHADALRALLASEPQAPEPAPAAPLRASVDSAPCVTGAVAPSAAEPIAVVGLSCRFPGAPDLDAYWELLRSGRSMIAPTPSERFGHAVDAHTALLDDLDVFDPDFFAIPEADARAMPAQARIVLELAVAAFSHAGYRPDEIKGRHIGVYLGGRGASPAPDALLKAARHPIRSVGGNYLAANVSYFFDLHGPSLVVDTACSSALTAMQAAIQAIRCGELEAALVGGVSVLDSDGPLRLFRQRGLESGGGQFHVFDRRANGVALGEGGGMALLKPVGRARRDGDTIYAVIEGIAVNSDGRTAGPSAPNIEAQIAVMAAALHAAGRRPDEITHIEVNGSGSEVSDLLELKALAATYGADTPGRRAGGAFPAESCISLGSIKPNIGHPLSAEGVASFIKLVCMLHHGELVPFLSGQEPPRHFDLDEAGFCFHRATAEWPVARRVGAVSCFGDGGANAHVVVSAAPAGAGERSPLPPPPMRRRDLVPGASRPAPAPAREGFRGAANAEGPLRQLLVLQDDDPMLTNHRAYGRGLMPGLSYIDIVLRFFREQGHSPKALSLRNMALYRPMIAPDAGSLSVDIRADRADFGWKVEIVGEDGAPFMTAEVVDGPKPAFDETLDLAALRSAGRPATSINEVYATCRAGGMLHDGVMKAEGSLFDCGDALIAEIDLPASARNASPDFLLHPTLLDASSLATGIVFADLVDASENLFLPLSLGALLWSAPLSGRCYARVRRDTARREGGMLIRDLELFDANGRKAAELRRFVCSIVRDPSRIAQGLAPAAPAPGVDDVVAFLRGVVMAQLGPSGRVMETDMPEDAGFYEAGLDSPLLLAAADALGRRLGRSLAPTLLFEFPTLRTLAEHLRVDFGRELAGLLNGAAQDRASRDDGPRRLTEQPAVPATTLAPAEPIAIIGLAGRYPGAADLTAFWRNLCAGKDCVTEIPPSRWDHRAYADLRSRTGRPISRWGGFIDAPDAFDARFFRISPREAELMDPQERLFLQVCWEALEDAGHTPETLAPAHGQELRRRVGVFAGVMHKDYTLVVAENATGAAPLPLSLNYAQIPNRVSYFFGFHGPSLAVDTVCSSSLVAVHLAVESLRRGETDACIAGGVNLSLHPAKYITYGQGNLFSTDGRCRAFGEGGDGYVPAEGVGAAVLKPLSRAIADRDPIYAVIRGSAVNHVGHVSGFTVPGPIAQADLVRQALDQAGMSARGIDYVEAHGTGTSLGDPIEIEGLVRAFSVDTADRQFCAIGSVKSNIGHAEAAAGISGLTKLALQIRHRTLVPSLHADRTNPHIDFAATPFRLQHTRAPWPDVAPPRPPCGAVSSFGATGTNAHLIVEGVDAPLIEASETSAPIVLPLSAQTDDQLRAYSERLRVFVLANPEANLAGLGATFQFGRKAFDARAVFIAADRTSLLRDLSAYASGGVTPVIPDESLASKLAKTWLDRGVCDWCALYEGRPTPRRLHAPTYPFAMERHWAPVARPMAPEIVLAVPEWAPVGGGGAPETCDVLVVASRDAPPPPWLDKLATGGRHSWLSVRSGAFEDVATDLFLAIKGRRGAAQEGSHLQIVVPGDAADGIAAGVAGLIRTARLEDPGLGIQLVALDAAAFENGATFAVALTDAARRTDCVALRRHSGRLETRVWREAPTTTVAPAWKDAGVYLITGGAGGLGLLFAQEIARQVAVPRIVLAGRSALDAQRRAAVDALCAAGAVASYRQADLADANETDLLVSDILALHGKLDGVLHSAGVLADSLIRNKTEDAFRRVLAPKIAGTRNLDAATASLNLDLFVLFASGAGAFGNPGQADYAAANAWQGEFAYRRSALTRSGKRAGRTLAIYWPLWEDGGMRPGETVEKFWSDQVGLSPLRTADGLAAFYRAVATQSPEALVLCGDAEKLRTHFGISETPAAPQPPQAPVSALAEKPSSPSAEADAIQPAILTYLKRLLGEIVKLSPEKIRADETLDSFGLDSVMVVQFGQGLAALSADIPVGVLYGFSNLHQLAGHLIETYPAHCAAWAGVAWETTPAVAPPIQTAPAETVQSQSVQALAVQAFAVQSTRPVAVPAEPIAIIGLAGRYPKAPDLRSFWENLLNGRDCIGEIPPDRWSMKGFYEPDRVAAVAQGRSYGKWGGFLEGFSDFDPLFFHISPMEAAAIDPQERLFIETAWEVFEEAGYSRDEIQTRHGGRVGVFAGITRNGFNLHALDRWRAGDAMLPATSFSSVANRISYLMNLHGPSMPIDTMCSSSLTAIHEACEHLRRGDCDMALAGGVNLYLHPLTFVSASAQQMLSPDGRCKSFGVGANGFVPGEGVGAALLKPLSAARRDGDHIHALILSTSINHNGRTNGYTVPNPRAQRDLVRAAIEKAGIDPASISVIEAHGTGTELGDPIEIEGLKQALETGAAERPACAVGSVKTNIGHLEAAAGIAGLTKVVLQMRHRTIVASLHSQEINPKTGLAGSPLYVPQQAAAWSTGSRDGAPAPRRAGVSSFGAGGANAHVVLQEAPPVEDAEPQSGEPALIVLSARSDTALRRLAEAHLAWLESETPNLHDMAFTLQVGREALSERLAIVATSPAELRVALRCFVEGHESDAVTHGDTRESSDFDLLREDSDFAGLVAIWAGQRRLARIASFWARGFPIDWRRLYPARAPRRISLPTTILERQRLWVAPIDMTRLEPSATQAQQTREMQETPPAPLGDVAGLMFRPTWRRLPASAGSALRPSAAAVVISMQPDDAFAASLAAILADAPRLTFVDPQEALVHALLALPEDGRAFLLADAPGEAQTRSIVVETLTLLHAARRAGLCPSGPRLVLVTRNAADGGASGSHGAGCHGLCLALNQSGWPAAACDVDEAELADPQLRESVLRLVAESTPRPRGELLRIRDGACHTRVLTPLETVNGPVAPVLRAGGCYVVVGGSGLLGRILTRHLIERCHAEVVWIGRAVPTDPTVRERLDEFATIGHAPVYLQADVTDAAALLRATERIGDVTGVFFAAMDFPPGGPFDVAPADLARAVAVKEAGVWNSFIAFRDRGPDFLCCFSSTQAYAFSDARDSAAYAAAIAAGDAATRRAAAMATFPVGAIHWGFWRAAIAGTILERNSGALDEAEGLACLEASLALLLNYGLDDVVCMRPPSGASRESVPLAAEMHRPVAPGPLGGGLAPTPAPPASVAGLVDAAAQARFNACAAQRLFSILAGMGCFDDPAASLDATLARTRIVGRYRRWLEEAFATLNAAGLTPALPPSPANREETMMLAKTSWAGLETSVALDPLLRPMVALVARCLDNLPAILLGDAAATEIVFPRGDIGALGGVYEGNSWSEFFNERLAEEAVAGVGRLRARDLGRAVRIVEIGAGTGGTTRVVLDRLRRLPGPIHYLYTDLSPAFLEHGRKTFAHRDPFVEFQRWNIEAAPEAQGVEPESYDIAIATNVLHATPDLRRALRNVKAALRRSGVLLLNETVWKTLYGTLTFGLLEGWWAFADGDLRIPGAPLLSPAGWRGLLEEEGFRPVRFLTEPVEPAAQTVVASASDGWLRVATEAPPPSYPVPTRANELALPPPGYERDVVAMLDVVRDALARALHIAQTKIDPRAPFSDYGVDSIVGAQLMTLIGSRMGVQLNASVLYEHTSAERLARHLARMGAVASSPAKAFPEPGVARTNPVRTDFAFADLEAAFHSGDLSVEEILAAVAGQTPAGG